MGIKIKNLRVSPYSQKDDIKVIFGDELKLSFEIAHVDGESYLCALDNERILYPVNRPVCAYTEVFTRDGDDVNFTLKLNTSKLRDYVSSIRKPMPVYLQIVRVVGGKYETVLLDDILAIPSVIDGSMTVYEGDPLRNLIEGKMDTPEQEGTAGQVLTMDADGHYTWQDPQGGGDENVQSDWDCSDSESAAYILNKPSLATVATTGSYNDLTDKPTIAGQEQANWDESDSSDVSFIKNKPTLFSGSYNDLTDKPVIPDAQVQSDWDESDSSKVDYIKHKPALATVATSGSYNDLSNKPVIVAPVNADWDESSSEDLSYILNKPEIEDTRNYLCFEITWVNQDSAYQGIGLNKVGTQTDVNWEYSFDRKTWHTCGFNQVIPDTNVVGRKVWIRGENETFSVDTENYIFIGIANVRAKVTGNIMSLLSKDLLKTTVPAYAFCNLFKGMGTLLTAPELPALNVGNYGYYGMFSNCSSLTEPPELPAINLSTGCYQYMFSGCMSLKHVKTTITAFSSEYDHWLDNVSSTGVFECSSALTISTRSGSTIPAGWVIVRYDAPQCDWSESDSTEASYILNKPTIPDAQVQADYDQSDSSAVDYIKNKPALATVATSGSYNDLSNKPDLTVDDNDYLCFKHVGVSYSTVTVKLNIYGSPNAINLEYSTDKKTWTAYTWTSDEGALITLQTVGDKVWFRGNNQTFSKDSSNYYFFYLTGTDVSASGNIMSLLDKTCQLKTVPSNAFYYLFKSCANLITAPEMPATTLSERCYSYMYNGCTSLVKAPSVLPATTLGQYCYDSMFRGCTALTEAPEFNAITLASNCCLMMFHSCTSLVKAPSVLPATTLVNSCYCYMFYNCTSLIDAPYIKATTLASHCCRGIYQGCTSLKTVKVAFTDFGTNQTDDWFVDASTNGIFECPSNLVISTRGTATVPATWTVVYVDDGVVNGIAEVDEESVSSAEISPSAEAVKVFLVRSSLTLNATAINASKVGYAEIVLDLAQGASVTAGTGLTLVDTPTAGKRNVCVARWQDGACKLYVTIVEDIPQA